MAPPKTPTVTLCLQRKASPKLPDNVLFSAADAVIGSSCLLGKPVNESAPLSRAKSLVAIRSGNAGKLGRDFKAHFPIRRF